MWLGFLGTDFEADIDLKEQTDISSIDINSYVNTRGGLFAPKSLALFVSADGNTYKEVHKEIYEERKEHISPVVITLSVNPGETARSRYIRVIAESVKVLPDWHEKKGDKAYLMIDEVRVY